MQVTAIIRDNDLLHRTFPNVSSETFDDAQEAYASFHIAPVPLISAYACIWIVGALGNLWVACIVGDVLLRRGVRQRTDSPPPVQIYIFALCVYDLTVLAFLPLLLVDLSLGSWMVPSSFMCRAYLFSEGLNKFGGPWILTAMSAFCYTNIRRTVCAFGNRNESQLSLHPNSTTNHHGRTRMHSYAEEAQSETDWEHRDSASSTFLSSFKRSTGVKGRPKAKYANGGGCGSARRAWLTVLVCTSAVVLATTPVYVYGDVYYLIVHNESSVNSMTTKCAFQPPDYVLTVFTVYSFIAGYLCPSVLFTFFYAAIVYYVRSARRPTAADRSGRYWRVAKTTVGLVLFYLACWTPYYAFLLHAYFNPRLDFDDDEDWADSNASVVFSYVVHCLPYLNCSGYPILYTFLNKTIRGTRGRSKWPPWSVSRKLRRSSRRRTSSSRRGTCAENVEQNTVFENHAADEKMVLMNQSKSCDKLLVPAVGEDTSRRHTCETAYLTRLIERSGGEKAVELGTV